MRTACGIGLVLLVLTSCSTAHKTPRLPQPSGSESQSVREVWEQHRSVLVSILEGNSYGTEFGLALEFFEATTGIAARDNKTFVGRIPSENLADDLRLWDNWYVDNAWRLSWDPKLEKVVVHEVIIDD